MTRNSHHLAFHRTFGSLRRTVLFGFALLLPVMAMSSRPVCAQTRPEVKVPSEPRPEAEAMVRELLRRGRILRTSDVKRGMRGYGRSVFQGTAIEQFPIEVLGVLERVNGGGDIVLIRVLGGTVIKRQSGIIAGMSGSPVYINGKMLGAIALGWEFPREPIAGVTPITEMIRTSMPDPEHRAPAPQPAMAKNDLYRPRGELHLAGRRIEHVVVTRDRNRLALAGPVNAATATMRPAATLLQMSGIAPGSLPRWRKMLEPYGIEPVIGPSSRKTGVKVNVVPGAALGVQLVAGDMDMTAIGTVTLRWGNRILAFGHPMMGKGAISLPMTTAYVHDIFPSYMESFKLGSPIARMGALQQDNLQAVGGTMGMMAETVPMHIHLVNSERGIDRRYNLQMMKDPVITPQLASQVALDAVMVTLGMDSDKMVRVTFRMDLEDAPPIVRTNYVYAQDYVIFGALGDAIQSLVLTQSNPYQRGAMKSVSLDVALEPVRKTARIRRIFADRNSVKAGDTFSVTVALEPTGQPEREFKRTFQFKVPEDAPSGVVRVAAGNAASFWSLRTRVGGSPPQTSNFKELLDAFDHVGPANELLVESSTPTAFWMIDRKRVDEPPPTWARLVRPETSSAVGIYNEVQLQREKSDYSLSGMQFLALPVESLRRSDRTPPEIAGDPSAAAKTGGDATVSSGITPPSMLIGGGIELEPPDGDEDAAAPIQTRRAALARFFAPLGVSWPAGASSGNASASLLDLIEMFMQQTGRSGQWDWLQTAPAITPVVPMAHAAATPSPSPTVTPTPTSDTATKVADGDINLARPVSHWVQSTAADFARGTFDGTVVTDDGMVQLAPSASLLSTTSDPIAWSVAAAPGGVVFLGTGHDARIYRIANGQVTTFYDGPEIAITSLTTDAAGNVYAGIAPGGIIYRFAPDGRLTHTWETEQVFVWALEWDASGRLLAGTGGKHGALRLVPGARRDGTLESPAADAAISNAIQVLAQVPQSHVRALSVRGDDVFLGAAGSEGVLYRFDLKTNALTALYQATPTSPRPPVDASAGMRSDEMGGGTMIMSTGGSRSMMSGDTMMVMGGANDSASLYARGLGRAVTGTEILAVAAAPEGVYFGTSLNGGIYRWTPDAGVHTVCNTAGQAVYALQRSPQGCIYAATGENGYVYEVRPAAADNPVRLARLLDAPQAQALALTISPTGELIIGTGNNAAVYSIPLQPALRGTFTSNVLDTRARVAWGALRATGSDAMALSTRSGNVLEPDASWSEWQPTAANAQGELHIASPAGRYLQYRVMLSRPDANAPLPTLTRFEALFRPRNQAPTVAMTAPAGGEFWHGKKTLTWNGQDPDKDTLRYRAWLSADSGSTWKSVEVKNPTTGSVEIDTAKWADGTYRARVEASDAARNPEDPQTSITTGDPFVIDNTAPLATPATVQRVTDGDKISWRITLNVADALSPLSGAEWRLAPAEPATPTPAPAPATPKTPAVPVKATKPATPGAAPAPKKPEPVKDADDSDDEVTVVTVKKTEEKATDWTAASAADGIFDSRAEQIIAIVLTDEARPEIKAGARIQIRVRDAAGNSTTMIVTLSQA